MNRKLNKAPLGDMLNERKEQLRLHVDDAIHIDDAVQCSLFISSTDHEHFGEDLLWEDQRPNRRRIAEIVSQLKAEEEVSHRPPHAAEFCLLLIPIRQREHLVGDLEEEYRTRVVPRYGKRLARLYYWWQVLNEIIKATSIGLRRVAVYFAILKLTR